MSDAEFYISVVFHDDQEAAVREAMRKNHITWADLKRIDNPDYYQWAYQVRLVFEPGRVRGDDNYADWQAGDTFVDLDDPQGRQYVAQYVHQDYGYIEFPHPERGSVILKFDVIRRVAKGER